MGPVVIVIDALVESGPAETRCNPLRILSGKLQNSGIPRITKLPKYFLFNCHHSPALRHSEHACGRSTHSKDFYGPEAAERDIYAYVSKKLEGFSYFGYKEFTALAQKVDGLFE